MFQKSPVPQNKIKKTVGANWKNITAELAKHPDSKELIYKYAAILLAQSKITEAMESPSDAKLFAGLSVKYSSLSSGCFSYCSGTLLIRFLEVRDILVNWANNFEWVFSLCNGASNNKMTRTRIHGLFRCHNATLIANITIAGSNTRSD